MPANLFDNSSLPGPAARFLLAISHVRLIYPTGWADSLSLFILLTFNPFLILTLILPSRLLDKKRYEPFQQKRLLLCIDVYK